MSLPDTIQDLGRRTALVTGAGLCLFTGAGFLTVAAWLGLSAARGPLFAATIIGLAYAGAGFLLLGLSGGRQRRGPTRAPLPPLNDAFMLGMEAGRAVRGSR